MKHFFRLRLFHQLEHAARGTEGGGQFEKILVASFLWSTKAIGDRHAAERHERRNPGPANAAMSVHRA